MSTICDTLQVTAAVWVINERLVHHTQPGKMLAGLHYDREGTLKVDGKDDLPLLQPWSLNIAEGLAPGASRASPASDINHRNSPVLEELTLVFRVGARRDRGFMRRDPASPTSEKGILEWLALIRDAIETDPSGVIDSSLRNSTSKPPRFTVQETETTQLAFYTFLEVVLTLFPSHRGERSYTFPEK